MMKEIRKTLGITSSLRVQLKDASGKETVELIKEGNVEKRFSRKANKAIQIVWKDGKMFHLHCYDKNCENEWKIKDGPNRASKFEINNTDIKCLKCGRVHTAG